MQSLLKNGGFTYYFMVEGFKILLKNREYF